MFCNKLLFTLSGKPRGFCSGKLKHSGVHGNNLCTMCGIQIRPTKHSWCRDCQEINRRNRGIGAPARQVPEKHWTFSCGCSCILPPEGLSDKFVRWGGSPRYGIFAHYCRAAIIINSNIQDAKRRNHKSIDPNTPHSVIWSLSEEKNCYRCRQPLMWEFGLGKTPHLHHDHKTGDIFGFTHPKCNPQALEDEIEELRKEIRYLKNSVCRVGD